MIDPTKLNTAIEQLKTAQATIREAAAAATADNTVAMATARKVISFHDSADSLVKEIGTFIRDNGPKPVPTNQPAK